MAVMGGMLEMMGIPWRMAFTKKTILESLVNCKSRDLGKKVMRLYLAVSILLGRYLICLSLRSILLDSGCTLGKNIPIITKYSQINSLYKYPPRLGTFINYRREGEGDDDEVN